MEEFVYVVYVEVSSYPFLVEFWDGNSWMTEC